MKSFLLNWAPEYDPDLASLGSTVEADLKALGIKLPLLKLPLVKALLIKGLIKFPIFKPVLKLFVKKPAKLLFETLIKLPPGIAGLDDPAAGLTPQSYESQGIRFNRIKFSLIFRLEKSLEFWLEITYTKKMFENG